VDRMGHGVEEEEDPLPELVVLTLDQDYDQVCMYSCLSICLTGWLDGWMADWMDGWLAGWLAGCLSVCLPACISICLRVCRALINARQTRRQIEKLANTLLCVFCLTTSLSVFVSLPVLISEFHPAPPSPFPPFMQVAVTDSRKGCFQRQLRKDIASAICADVHQVCNYT